MILALFFLYRYSQMLFITFNEFKKFKIIREKHIFSIFFCIIRQITTKNKLQMCYHIYGRNLRLIYIVLLNLREKVGGPIVIFAIGFLLFIMLFHKITP